MVGTLKRKADITLSFEIRIKMLGKKGGGGYGYDCDYDRIAVVFYYGNTRLPFVWNGIQVY
jgi:hypothetical protein